jgi:Zn-dependent protease with chaperone function
MFGWMMVAAVFTLADERKAIASDIAAAGRPACTSYHPDGSETPCRPAIALVPGRSINAWRQGSQIRFTRAASERLNRDEFALLVSHEIAHYYLGHTENSRANELAADRLGAELACKAGYDPQAGASLLRYLKAGPHHPDAAERRKAILEAPCPGQAGSVSAS